MAYRQACILVLIIIIVIPKAGAIPGRLPDLDRATEESSLIVVGELVSVQQGIGRISIDSSLLRDRFSVEIGTPRITARIDRGTIRVNDVVKGDSPSRNLTFNFLVPDIFLGWVAPPEGAHGVFFFKATDSGTLDFTDPYFPWIPANRGLNITGETPLHRIVNVLSETISNPYSVAESKGMAVLWLQFSKNSASSLALRSVLENPDPALSLNAAGGLLYRGDTSGMDVIKRAFLQTGPLPMNLETTIPNLLKEIRDPGVIPDLNELLDASSVHMRRGAAFALMRTGSRNALNPMHKALEDSDVEVRYYGALGLAEINGQSAWRPSMEEFKSDENKFLLHWKQTPRNQ